MRNEKEIIGQLLRWAKNSKNVHVILQTSSRTNPQAFIDRLSDYDIELFVRDIKPFLNDRWLKSFGAVLVRWPLKPENQLNRWGKWITRLVVFEDGTKIDFSISTRESIKKIIDQPGLIDDYDIGYRVLLDKDGLTKKMKPPTHTAYQTKKPSQKQYLELVNEFWWDTTYVAKSLWRDQLFFAKFIFGNLHEYLRKMLEWHIGLQYNWKVNPGNKGRWIKKYLDRKTWTQVEATFAGARREDNWNALFRTTRLFGRLAKEIGNELKYKYPASLDRKMTAYLLKIRKLRTI